jgi:hypothetical protein
MTASSFNVNYPISTTGNITAPNFIGNLIGNISGNITIPGSNTQVLYNINGNIGAAPGFTFDSAANALLVTGTVTGGNLVTSGVVSATGSITSDANITGVQFIGSGSTLSNIQGGNVSGTVSRATLADTAYAVSGANVSGTVANATYAASSGFAGTVTENAQSNITSLGTLTSLSVTGNTRSGNLLTSGLISASGVVTGSSHLGAVVSASGNIIGGNLVTAGLVSATGSITTAANITGGNLLTSGLISATSTITSTANIIGGNIATAGSLTATGNISGGNFLTAGIVSATGNITAPYFVGNLIGNISGNLIVPGANTQVIYNNTGQANASAGLTFDFASNSLVSTGTVTGSNLLTVGYVSAAGNVIGNRIIGNGATLSSITGANVSGNVANATYAVSAGSAVGTAATVTANAQPNITSVGTLTSLAVTANVTGGNILTAGQISSTGNITTAGYFVGTLFGNVTGNITIPGLNTQVIYNNNGNAGASAGFTFDSAANALVLTGTVTGSNFLTGGYVSAAGNIIGNYIIGNGATLSSITAANINGTVANATYAISSGTSATVTTNSQPNITSVGTLTSLAVTSNVTGGNLLTGGYISATGNITTAGYFFGTFAGNISGNLTVPGANTQVIYNNNGNAGASAGLTFNSASNAMVVTGTVTGSNFLTGGYVSAAGNIIGNNIIGNGSLLSSLTGANVSGTVANATYATSAGYSATVTSNAQGNITSLGTLTSLTVTANTQTGNLLTGGYISAAGNIITAGVFVGTFAGNISGNLTVPGANTQVIYNNSGNAGASAGLTFNSASNAMVVTGTVTGGNILTGGLISSTGAITGSSHLGAVVSVTGNVTGNYLIGNGSILSSITGANVSGTVANATAATYAATITTNAQPNITSVGTLTSLTVTANVTGGNILTAGLISSTGNITGGNLSVGTGIITVGNIVNSNGNAVGNIGSSSNYFNTVFAQATSALYADLAENYLADAEYTPGTVLSFGGEEELTISTQDNDPLIAGIISTNPAYQMNSGLTGKFVVALALAGRVPCLVQGPVTAGAMMVSAGNGRARAEINPKMGTVIGKAITGFAGNLGVIEILVGRL